jgi:hypothetical protein
MHSDNLGRQRQYNEALLLTFFEASMVFAGKAFSSNTPGCNPHVNGFQYSIKLACRIVDNIEET